MIDRRHTTLPNGIDLVTDTAPHFQGVAIAVSFRVGSVHEPDDKSGISHLLEHLVFRGSEDRPGADIQAAFGQLGGYLNARTQEDETTFEAITLADDLDAALGLLAEMVSRPALADDDIEMEKQIIEQENCRGCYQCSMRDAFFDQAYPEQSIRNPVIGYEDTLQSITRDDLLAFHAQAYVGRNLTIAIAGNITHEAALDLVAKAFGDLPAGKAAGYPALRYNPGELLLAVNGEQGRLRIGFSTTGWDVASGRAAGFYQDILGGHAMSRLMIELREKRGLVYGAWADTQEIARQSLVMVEVAGETRKMDEISRVAIQTMRDTAYALDEGELALAKRRAHAGLLMSLDNLTARVSEMTYQMAQFGRLSDWTERRAAYQAMTLEDVQAAGQRILATDPVMVASGPVRNMPKFVDLRAAICGADAKSVVPREGGLRLVH